MTSPFGSTACPMRLDDCTGGCFSDDMGCEDFVQTYDLFQPEVS